MFPSVSLFPSIRCHKSFSNFFLIVDFVLSCSCYLCNNFHMNCLMYFILSCVSSCLVVIVTTILILLFFHRYSFSWNILSSKNRYTRYVQRLCKQGMYKNYEEYCYLVLEEVCFIFLGLLWGFPFFDNSCFMCFLHFV